MSGATYRIEVEHRPAESDDLKWVATVTRLSDGHLTARWAVTREHAEHLAREYVRLSATQQEGQTLYVDDEGQDADAPHSVKVT